MSAADGIDWATAGPLAAAFIAGGYAFYKEWVVPGKTYKRELNRNDEQAKQIEELQTTIKDDFLPEYRKGNDALAQLAKLLPAHDPGPGGGG